MDVRSLVQLASQKVLAAVKGWGFSAGESEVLPVAKVYAEDLLRVEARRTAPGMDFGVRDRRLSSRVASGMVA